jgi:hypothetical protein
MDAMAKIAAHVPAQIGFFMRPPKQAHPATTGPLRRPQTLH